MSSYAINCLDGKVLKEIQGGVDKYGNEIKSVFRCVAPTSVLDCPPNTRFYNPTRGKCIPINNDGYGEGYGYEQAPPIPQPKSQADCPSGSKFKFREENDGYGNSKQIAYCGEPESQEDCPDGTTFIQGRSSDGMKMVYTASRCQKNKNCEQKYVEYLAYIKKYGPQIKIMQKTKEEFMAECNGTTIPTPVNPVEKVVEAIKPKTEEEEYRNFIYLAMAGIGVYLLLSE